MDGQGGRRPVAGKDGVHHILPVHRLGDGPAHVRVPAQALLGVEAQVQHLSGVVVPHLIPAGGAQGAAPRQVYIHQGDLPGVEGGHEPIRPGHGGQRDLGNGQVFRPSVPVAPGGEAQAAAAVGEHIGPGAQWAVPLPQGNGDVQQLRQGPVGLGEGDGHLVPAPLDRGDRGEPGGVPGALPPGGLEGLGHNLPGEGGPVGEGDPRLEGKGPGEAVLTDRIALAQRGLGLEGAVQGKEPLVHQRGQGQIDGVFRQHRVEAVRGAGRQCKGRAGRRLLRLGLGRSGGAGTGGAAGRGGGAPLRRSAAGSKQQDTGQCQGRQPSHVSPPL